MSDPGDAHIRWQWPGLAFYRYIVEDELTAPEGYRIGDIIEVRERRADHRHGLDPITVAALHDLDILAVEALRSASPTLHHVSRSDTHDEWRSLNAKSE